MWLLILAAAQVEGQVGDGVAGQCRANVVVTGYWPPTNEMLRQFSQRTQQNAGGWQGGNWRDSGYDVFAFFPEFPPDGDPTNDEIGQIGSVGGQDADLRVDYQDTSRDFWRIMDTYQPRILITSSRGGDIGWEIEAYEGGHGAAGDWISDRWGEQTQPTAESIDPRSTQAIRQYADNVVRSSLPIHAIAHATRALRLTSVQIDTETSGSYLSGFMGLHGIFYHQTHLDNVAAGHIHVGRHVEPAVAKRLFEATLAAVLAQHPLDCRQLTQGE